MGSSRKDKLYVILLLSPMTILLLTVVVYPILNTFYLSFHYSILYEPDKFMFIGIKNYVQVFKDPIFYIALKNTGIWVAVTLSFQFIIGLITALLLNQDFKGRGLVRSVVLIPWVTSGTAIALMFAFILDGNYGVINQILFKLGIITKMIPWLATEQTSLYAQCLALIWQGSPFFAIMILAALQSIPHDIYDAAHIDGCSSLDIFKYITWPYILPTVIITTLLRLIWITNNIDIIYIMTQGGPANSSLTLPLYTFMQAKKALNFGYSSALAMVLTLIVSVFLFNYVRLQETDGGAAGK